MKCYNDTSVAVSEIVADVVAAQTAAVVGDGGRGAAALPGVTSCHSGVACRSTTNGSSFDDAAGVSAQEGRLLVVRVGQGIWTV